MIRGHRPTVVFPPSCWRIDLAAQWSVFSGRRQLRGPFSILLIILLLGPLHFTCGWWKRRSGEMPAGGAASTLPSVTGATFSAVTDGPARWLVLVVRVPADPSRHRVAVWRELRRAGAVS